MIQSGNDPPRWQKQDTALSESCENTTNSGTETLLSTRFDPTKWNKLFAQEGSREVIHPKAVLWWINRNYARN
jgi:hypothetical protein